MKKSIASMMLARSQGMKLLSSFSTQFANVNENKLVWARPNAKIWTMHLKNCYKLSVSLYYKPHFRVPGQRTVNLQ